MFDKIIMDKIIHGYRGKGNNSVLIILFEFSCYEAALGFGAEALDEFFQDLFGAFAEVAMAFLAEEGT